LNYRHCTDRAGYNAPCGDHGTVTNLHVRENDHTRPNESFFPNPDAAAGFPKVCDNDDTDPDKSIVVDSY